MPGEKASVFSVFFKNFFYCYRTVTIPMVMGITADVKKLHNGKKMRRKSFLKKAGSEVSGEGKKGKKENIFVRPTGEYRF